jgi:16S rRNA (cytosine967-C5)-methyltransferase
MKEGPRSVAVDILCRWQQTGMPIDQLMEQMPHRLPDPRDRQLVFALIYGTLRWLGYLDWILADFSSYPLQKMKTPVRQALRVGLYQLLFMDRIPDSAAINETVEAVKAARQPRWLTGFVNGLLRNIARRKEHLPDPLQENSVLPATARLNHPQWLVERWRERYGEKMTTAICRLNNTPPPLCLRVNTSAITADSFLALVRQANISAGPGIFTPDAILLHGFKGTVAEIPGYDDGFFQVQDEAAQLVSLLLAPMAAGKTYLDGCAGLGGKTSHLAQMLAVTDPAASVGSIVAVEPSRWRIRLLQENLQRLKLARYVTVIPGRLGDLGSSRAGSFAAILIDAPCSGLGVVRRRPDVRWRRTPADLHRYQRLQSTLLDSAAPLLAQGGILVYATCSMEPEENEAVVAAFLARHADFSLTDCRAHLPPGLAGLVDGQGFFRTVPGRDGVDGFFAGRLQKKIGMRN